MKLVKQLKGGELFKNSPFLPEPRFRRVSAADVLSCVSENMGSPFSDHISRISKMATNYLPYSGNIIEFHFNREPWFDFAFRISAAYDKPFLAVGLGLHNANTTIQAGCRQLVDDQNQGFNYGIANIWLEYDFPVQTAPSLFFDIKRDITFSPRTAFCELAGIARSFNYRIYAELAGFLTKIRDLGLRVVYYGFMFSRKPEYIRLTVNGVRAGNLIETLRSLDWKGNYELVQKIRDTYLNRDQNLVIAVDFDNAPGKRLGIEVFDPQPEALETLLHPALFFNKHHYTLLKHWPGCINIPDSLSESLTGIHQRPVKTIYKRINHFKFTIAEDILSLKAYLYYCF